LFRAAEFTDAELLWRWRLASEREGAEGGWWKGKPSNFSTHCNWLNTNLRRVLILIWEENKRPHGMVRIESDGSLSFFVPKIMREDGVAKRMLAEVVKTYGGSYGGRLKACVDAGNVEAWQDLRDVGFVEYPVKFLAYKQPPNDWPWSE
jgi:GNAT superfamily N-acetyltransferase